MHEHRVSLRKGLYMQRLLEVFRWGKEKEFRSFPDQAEEMVRNTEKKYTKYYQADEQHYQRIRSLIEEKKDVISSVRKNLFLGGGNWEESLQFRKVILELKKLLKKTKLLQREDVNVISLNLEDITRGLSNLEKGVLLPEFGPIANVTSYSSISFTLRALEAGNKINLHQQKKLDAAQQLFDLETQMQRILQIIGERHN
jgi:hypothetical protein